MSPRYSLLAPVVITALIVMIASGCGPAGDREEPEAGHSTSPVVDTVPGAESAPDSPARNQPRVPAASEVDTVAAVAVEYARSNNPGLSELEVLAVEIEGDWARVDLRPVDRSTDMASALLKSTDGGWSVAGFGFLVPENYPEAPAGVFD